MGGFESFFFDMSFLLAELIIAAELPSPLRKIKLIQPSERKIGSRLNQMRRTRPMVIPKNTIRAAVGLIDAKDKMVPYINGIAILAPSTHKLRMEAIPLIAYLTTKIPN
jgi:hypothetical protein